MRQNDAPYLLPPAETFACWVGMPNLLYIGSDYNEITLIPKSGERINISRTTKKDAAKIILSKVLG